MLLTIKQNSFLQPIKKLVQDGVLRTELTYFNVQYKFLYSFMKLVGHLALPNLNVQLLCDNLISKVKG